MSKQNILYIFRSFLIRNTETQHKIHFQLVSQRRENVFNGFLMAGYSALTQAQAEVDIFQTGATFVKWL